MLGVPPMPDVVKKLMIAIAAAFVIQSLARLPGGGLTVLERFGALTPSQFASGMIWQPLSRLFLHSEFGHLAGNLFVLWMFGGAVASEWGARRFLALFLGGGALGGVLQAVGTLALAWMGVPLAALFVEQPSLGASGAVYTVMTVFALANPRRQISLLFVPLAFEARWLIPIVVGLELGFPSPGISHGAHLLGVLIGWLAVRGLGPSGDRQFGAPRPPPPARLRLVPDREPPLAH